MTEVQQLESYIKSFLNNCTENISVQIYKDNWLISIVRKEEPIQTIVIDNIEELKNENN